MGRQWELSYRLGMRPDLCCLFSTSICKIRCIPSIPIRSGFFLRRNAFRCLRYVQLYVRVPNGAQHLMHPFHMAGVAGMFGGALQCNGSLLHHL